MPVGGQIGNKNAEKWTEEKAIEIGESLIEWLTKTETNVLFKYYLMVEGKQIFPTINYQTIEYLGSKYESFSKLIKEAREIQKIKLQHLGLTKKVDSTQSIWLSRINHGVTEDGIKDQFNFEKEALKEDISRFLTKSTEMTNVHLRNLDAVRRDKKILLNRGGTRSSKTHSICQIAKDFLFTGKIANKEIEGHAGVFRKTLPALKLTFLNDFLKILDEKGIELNEDVKYNKTEHYFERDGRRFYFGSLNNDVDIKKARGLGLGLIILNEANEMAMEAYLQLIMRSRANAIIILDFNPDNPMSYVNETIEKERAEKRGDVAIIHSTYKDNTFLPQDTINEIEYFREIDPDLWAIYGGGLYGGALGRVYSDWKAYDELPPGDYITCYGEDFGFSNSYDAVVEINYNKGNHQLYVRERLYEKGLLHNELTDRIISIVGDRVIFADCNESRMLTDIMTSGVNIYKPKKSRKRQLELSKMFKINIHSGSLNLEKERKTFVYLKDSLGKLTNEVIEVNDHLIKALHYGITGLIDYHQIEIPQLKGEK